MYRLIRSLRPTSLEQLCLLITAALIPLQRVQVVRKGITIFHVVNALLLAIMLVIYLHRRAIRWHFAGPLCIYLIGSLVGMFSSRVIGLNLYTLAQDLYLYLWFTVLCVMLSSKRNVECLVSAWLFCVIVVLSTDNLFTSGTHRPEFTFRNPNRAAAYMVMSSALLLHRSLPMLLKLVVVVGLLVGVRATGSTAGFLALLMGTSVFLWSWFRVRAPRASSLAALSGAAAVLVAVLLMGGQISRLDAIGTLEHVAPEAAASRIERSSSVRGEIWALGLKTFLENPLGIGPASFFGQIESRIGTKHGIELHSDVMASLVERGVVGFAGFVAFNIAIAGMLLRTLRLAAAAGNRQHAFWAAVLAGGVVAYLSFMLTHEVLHHETFWLLLALATVHHSSLERLRRIEIRVTRTEAVGMPTRFHWPSTAGTRVLPDGDWRA